jgi:hypothetical protein
LISDEREVLIKNGRRTSFSNEPVDGFDKIQSNTTNA